MIKLEQKGFTLVELLISIGILGIVAPLLGLALFQILTFTERGRAGFEAQADTRTAAGWISQDIVMAQETGCWIYSSPACSPLDLDVARTNPDCATPVGFTWTDYFDDRDTDHQVTYCWFNSGDPADDTSPLRRCLAVSPCLVRNFKTFDSDGNTTSDSSKVIARNIESVEFRAVTDKEIEITIKSITAVFREGSLPVRNRFGVEDEKTFKVLMRPTL